MNRLTQWAYHAFIIADDKSFVNGLAMMAATFPGENQEFGETGLALSPGGWLYSFHCTKQFANVLDALNQKAPIGDPRLARVRGRGLNVAQWNRAKSDVLAYYYRLHDLDGNYRIDPVAGDLFAASQGYTIIPVPVEPEP